MAQLESLCNCVQDKNMDCKMSIVDKVVICGPALCTVARLGRHFICAESFCGFERRVYTDRSHPFYTRTSQATCVAVARHTQIPRALIYYRSARNHN